MAEHATTGDAINHAVDKASDGIAQITHAIAGAAPKVTQVTLAAVQADAYSNVVYGVEALLVVAVAAFVWRRFYWTWVQDDGDEIGVIFAGLVLGGIMAVFSFVAICTVFNPWTYIAMQHPDLYLAHKIMAQVSK